MPTSAHERTRVGYVVKRFPRLSETFVINELRALRELGACVEVFSLSIPEPSQQDELLAMLDVPVWYLPDRHALGRLPIEHRNYGRKDHSTDRLRTWLRTEGARAAFPGKRPGQCATLQLQGATLAALAASRRIDHFHAHFATDATTVAMLASRLSGTPFSFTAHAKDIYHVYSDPVADARFLRIKLREARFSVTVSDYNRRHLQKLGGPGATVHRIYNGVDLERLPFHKGPREPGLILAVGRLVEKKGFRHLLDALALLRERVTGFRCVLLGDGPERAALEAQATRLGLQDRVQFAGARPQPEIIDWLRRATVFALPCVVAESGDRDGLPTVLLECLALGTPAVSTDLAGIPEILAPGCGWRVPPGDAAALADALGEALAASREARTTMGTTGRARAERLFDLRANARRLADLLATGGNRSDSGALASGSH